MNRLKNTGGILLLILMVASCKGTESEPVEELSEILPGELKFEVQNFEKQLSSCDSDSLNCAKLKAIYPLAKYGEASIAKSINDTISFYIRESLSVIAVSREDVLQSLDSIAAQFFVDYEEVLNQSPDYQMPWEVETEGKVLFQSDKVCTIEINNFSFTGGAHPNSYTTFLNFDLNTGDLMNIEDIVGNMDSLKLVVEEKFRAHHDLEEKEGLNEAGFFWDQDFYLPANFALVDSGLLLYYNAYEAADYATGPTQLELKSTELEGILKQ